jgi:hypothetical protein
MKFHAQPPQRATSPAVADLTAIIFPCLLYYIIFPQMLYNSTHPRRTVEQQNNDYIEKLWNR